MKVYRFSGSSSIGRFVLPLLLLQQSFVRAFVASRSSGPHYKTVPLTGGYELVCRKHEILQCTVPCCEPTCDNDCSTASCPVEIVLRNTCVCEPGYVRHKGKCIHPSRCPLKPPAPCVCEPTEELLPSPPSCEPTCSNDCSGSVYHTRYIDQPTCVCRKGYRRHNGKCIRADQCPTCGPYATLRPHAPCCEPTCVNDCNNVICLSESYGEPACVCQDGYVKHNATCIRREMCPQQAHRPAYLTYVPETGTDSPYLVYPTQHALSHFDDNSDHFGQQHETSFSVGCDCLRKPCPHTAPKPKPTKPTPNPTTTVPTPTPSAKPIAPYLVPFPSGCGCGQSPCPHVAQPAPPIGCGCGQNPCPNAAAQPSPPTGCGQKPCPYSVETKLPVPYYQVASVPTQKDQPYYTIPALKQCSCNIANGQKPAAYCPTPGLGYPIRPTVAPCKKHTATPQQPEPTYQQAKDPFILGPYQLAPFYTVATPSPATTTTATTAKSKYDPPYYQQSDQVLNVPYQYVPQQCKSANVVYKDQSYLPMPATDSPMPAPIDVAYIRPPSPPCFSSYHR